MPFAATVFCLAAPSGYGLGTAAPYSSSWRTADVSRSLTRFSVDPAAHNPARQFVAGKVPLGLKRKGLRVLVTDGAGFIMV
ncbi:hypothetical protein ZWY2020_038161 [Hordeum vulgare]|nr:hypothetical protein ZWY2020_038161 [Hordeum vulgare]